MAEWNPDEIMQAIELEVNHGVQTDGGEIITVTPEDIARRTAKDAVALAMKRIVNIALYSESETRAMAASMYIVDRVMGKTTDLPMGAGDKDDALRALVEGVSANGG